MIVHRHRQRSIPTCPHCGKEIPEEPGSFVEVALGLAGIFLAVGALIVCLGTVLSWAIGEQDTLWHSIQNTVNHIVSLARRLW